MTFTLSIIVPLLKELIDRQLIEHKHDTHLKNIVYTFYWDLCSLKSNFLVENYVFIFFSLPLTVFLYFWNSFHLERRKKFPIKKKKIEIKKTVEKVSEDVESDLEMSNDLESNKENKSTKKEVEEESSTHLRCNFDFRILGTNFEFELNF